MRTHYGVNLEKKRPLVEGRLGFYISSLGYATYQEYFDYALNSPATGELGNLLNRLTTNHTFFMREHEHFDYYRDVILPWISEGLGDKDLRVWSAGCSSGQEPYTISMVTIDYLRAHHAYGWDNTILASDISDRALRLANAGTYSAEDLDSMPEEWVTNYFTKTPEGYFKITPELRRSVALKRINLIDDFNFKAPFHAIFCRNVMIYFDTDTKTRIVNKMYDVLRPGGYLLIGHSESLSTLEHKFEYVSPSIYKKNA
jgi:chemotaxis protein methyltransferase CheR